MDATDGTRWWPAPDGSARVSEVNDGRDEDDSRDPFVRDRDRLLYTDEFERLRGVTQVVSPTEGILCHDRHSHSLRVEQLAMRMAQNPQLLATRPNDAPDEAPDLSVVAAAALAHDLGHPPFGHVAEEELDALLRQPIIEDEDGFEGNAQSFRILTRLAAHRRGGRGLRLTRRVLRATLKYPWLSPAMPARYEKHRKYGAYLNDRAAFEFAIRGHAGAERAPRSLEAAIMDAADAITYSVHDLLDFFRAGLIDLGRLQTLTPEEYDAIARSRPKNAGVRNGLLAIMPLFAGFTRYEDSLAGRSDVQQLTSRLITTLVGRHALRWNAVDGWEVVPDPETEYAMDFLKGLTRRYVIDSDTLAVTQVGHRRVVRRLFKLYIRSLVEREHRVFPAQFRGDAEQLGREIRDTPLDAADETTTELAQQGVDSINVSAPPVRSDDPVLRVPKPLRIRAARLAADVVASLTDRQALSLNLRVSGLLPQDGFAGQRDA
ncbi:MAG: dNTP triphosphohydrolase [Gemmatimonadaceae bacterium]|nr:dNTP triphosphohydrolase [Gemmatimonadaceae bacterium]